MDCCGSSKPKEIDKDAKIDQKASENNPVQKEQVHGCCGGGGMGMWLHLVLMILAILVISYFTRR